MKAKRHLVTIERVTKDPKGLDEDQWSSHLIRWCAITNQKNNETVAQNQVQSYSTATFIFYGLQDITTMDRIVYSGKAYNIGSVVDKEIRGRETIVIGVSHE